MTANDPHARDLIYQAAAIPYRFREPHLEFCLITSIKKSSWGFPKGIIDPGETYRQTALKEAFEEAGLHGQIVGEPLGSYHDTKWGAQLEVKVVLMEVARSDADWEESAVRQRRWVPFDDALQMLSRRDQAEFLKVAMQQLDPSAPA